MTRNSTIQVTLSGPSPIETGRHISLDAPTHSSTNKYKRVCVGARIAPPIFSLVKASTNKMSAKLLLIVNQDRLNSVVSFLDFSYQSIIVWMEEFVGLTKVKVIGTLSLQDMFAMCSTMLMYSP